MHGQHPNPGELLLLNKFSQYSVRTCESTSVVKISEDICEFDFKFKAPSGGFCGALHLKQFLNLQNCSK